MSTPITTLITSIKTLAGTFLGEDFKEVQYGIDLATNRSRGTKKTYAVLPGSAEQQDSIGALVMDQNFTFKLTDSYNPGKVNDHNTQVVTNSLYDKVYALYNYIVSEKCGSPSLVMITDGLSVSAPEYLDEETVLIQFTFYVKHRLIT